MILNRFEHKLFFYGHLKVTDNLVIQTLEPKWISNEEKIIREGLFILSQRKVVSPMTERWRKAYDWFTWFWEIQDVPGRDYIYFHEGTDINQSEGCVLITGGIQNGVVIGHIQATKEFYMHLNEKSHHPLQIRNIE